MACGFEANLQSMDVHSTSFSVSYMNHIYMYMYTMYIHVYMIVHHVCETPESLM